MIAKSRKIAAAKNRADKSFGSYSSEKLVRCSLSTLLCLSSLLPVSAHGNAPAPAPVHQSPNNSAPQVIRNSNLTGAQLGQILSSGSTKFSISPNTPIRGNVFIPRGITLVDNVSSAASTFAVRGNFVSSGNLIFNTADASAKSASLIANNIIVNSGALISSLSGLSLSLIAKNNIVNSGTISSSGNLSLIAGGYVNNVSPVKLAQGGPAPQALIQAQNNINISSGIGSITNNGTVSSLAGNINVLTAATASQILNLAGMNTPLLPNTNKITINAPLGSFSALLGSINIGDNTGLNTGDINLSGGDYYSNELNLYAGSNTITSNVGQVTGTVNTQANVEHFNASASTLTLGTNCITGDPTFVNTAVGGNIVITGVNTFSENVAILANGDITTTGGGQIVAHGANVIIVAGAKTAGNDTGGTIPPITGTNAAATITLDPAQSNGGDINFSNGAAAIVIDTSAQQQTQTDSGSVILAAMSSNGGHGGHVLLGTNSIYTNSLGDNDSNCFQCPKTHNAGNVTIIAGGNPGSPSPTITAGTIYTGAGFQDSSPATSGTVSIYTQQPASTNANKTVTFNKNGNITSGAIKNNGLTIKTAAMTLGDIITTGPGGSLSDGIEEAGSSGAPITLIAGADINAANLLAFGAGGSGGSIQGIGNGQPGGNGAPISVTSANGNITITGTVSSSGGGGGGGVGAYLQNGGAGNGTGGSGGKAANIEIIASNGSLMLGAIFAANGANGGAGGNTNGFGGGGGGGGSYGGGGGGGADQLNGGGGGGGGVYGGGGGSSKSGQGGSGTGGGAPGFGGHAGTAGSGGDGNTSTGGINGSGGSIGQGGTGAHTVAYNAPGAAGGNVTGGNTTVTLSAVGGVVTGAVVGGTVSITAGGGANVDLGGSLTGFTKTTIVTQDGNVTQTSGSINTPVLTLSSKNGAFGTQASPLSLGVGQLSFVTQAGLNVNGAGVFLTNSGNITLTQAKDEYGPFSLIAEGNITTSNTKINCPDITLKSNSGSINVAVDDVDNLIVNSPNGNATIVSKGGTHLGPSSAGGTFNLTITPGDPIINLIPVPPNLYLNGITANSIVIVLQTPDSPLLDKFIPSQIVQQSAVPMTASSISITMQTVGATGSQLRDQAAIGASGAPILTATSNLTVNAASVLSGVNVYISNVGSVHVTKSAAGSNPKVHGTPQLVFSLTTTKDGSGNGQIVIGTGGITVSNPGGTPGSRSAIILNSDEGPAGKGGILVDSTGAFVCFSCALNADNITLIDGAAGAGTKAIGAPTAPIRLVNAGTVSANTQSSVYLSNSSVNNIQVLDSSLPSGSTFLLLSSGSINAVAGFGTITASSIVLSAGATGSIGSASAPALLVSDLVTLSAGQNVYASDTSANPILLRPLTVNNVNYKNSATLAFSFVAPNSPSLSNQQELKATDIALSAQSVSIIGSPTAFPLTASRSISLSSTGSQASDNVSLSAPITAPAITLTAGKGTIVQQTEGVITASGSLTINLTNGGTANLPSPNKFGLLNDNVTGSGQVIITNFQPMLLGTINGAQQDLSIKYTTSLSNKTDFTVNNLTLVTSGCCANNTLLLSGTITANGNAQLSAIGTGNITVKGLIGTGDKNLAVGGSGQIFASGPITGNQVTLTTNGGNIQCLAPVSAAAALVINLLNGGSAQLNAAGDFSVFSDKVVNNGSVTINSGSPLGLTLSSIAGGGQSLTATAATTIVTPNPIEAHSLSLTAGGAGGIASNTFPVTTDAVNLQLNAKAQGANVFAVATNPAGVNLSASSASTAGQFNLSGAEDINVTGAIGGGLITLTSGTSVSTGGITFSGLIGGASTNNVTMLAKGTGAIVPSGAAAKVQAQTVQITSSGGSIGLANSALKTVSNNMTFTTSGNGLVNVDNTTTGGMVLNNSSSGLAFSFSTTGPLTLNSVTSNAGAAASTGSITIIVKNDAINFVPSSSISASGGNVWLQDKDAAKGSIQIGGNSTIKASSTVANVGNVTILLGTLLSILPGTTPPNVTENITNGGKILYGKNGITALPPNNTLNALGRVIHIDTASNLSGAITLAGGVTITADPPEGAAMESISNRANDFRMLLFTPGVLNKVSSQPLDTTSSSAQNATSNTTSSLALNAVVDLSKATGVAMPRLSQAALSAPVQDAAIGNVNSLNAFGRKLISSPTREQLPALVYADTKLGINSNTAPVEPLNGQQLNAEEIIIDTGED